MKIVVDSNIFLNVFNHENFEKQSFDFLGKIQHKQLSGFISSVQIPEIYRSVFNLQGEAAAAPAVGYTRNLVSVLSCSEEIGFQAAPLYAKYKNLNQKFSIIDAILVATALDIGADYIVTRDPDFNIVTEIKCKPPEKIIA